MVATVQISVRPDSEQATSSFSDALHRLEQAINATPEGRRAELVEAGARLIAGLSTDDNGRPDLDVARTQPAIALLLGDKAPPLDEQMSQEIVLIKRSFSYRRRLLDASLSNTEVADLLGISRQTPHDRVANGTLLAVKDYNGALRYPIWQFDPEGPGGVVDGLPTVLRALQLTPWEKAGWLSREQLVLDGERPIDVLRNGGRDTVLALARSVGVN
ncbi:MAG: hypothetical protein QM589_16170 [Thermomicrobiales bacterium]